MTVSPTAVHTTVKAFMMFEAAATNGHATVSHSRWGVCGHDYNAAVGGGAITCEGP